MIKIKNNVNNELVSIIMPVFNSEKYICNSVESLLNQSYKNIEIIIIDDGSIDNSKAICEKLAIKDKRIKFLKEDMSVIKDDFVRHNSMLIADTLIKIICDDLKFKDRQNEPEYLMMNSKLQMDKEIKKEMIRQNKNKKSDTKKTKSKSKSKRRRFTFRI